MLILVFLSKSRPGTNPNTTGVSLYARRESDQVKRSIRAEFVLTLDTTDIREVLAKLLDAVQDDIPEQCRDGVRLELTGEEAQEFSGLGNGVAVPHASVDGLLETVCAIARVPNGVAISSPDDEPVCLVFLLLSRGGDTSGHLHVLADIARLASHSSVRDRIMAAESEQDAVAAVWQFLRAGEGPQPSASGSATASTSPASA